MKIIGKTLEGDLIISVSQDEWDGLWDGVKPKDNDWASKWSRTEVYRGLDKEDLRGIRWRVLMNSFQDGEFDGTWESLEAMMSSGDEVRHIGKSGMARLRDIARQKIVASRQDKEITV